MKRPIFSRVAPAVTLAASLLAAPAIANDQGDNTVRNLERERAAMVSILLDADISPADRQRQITQSQRRLVDLERIVLRDDSLKGVHSMVVKKAFANYDLTFLAHAALEDGQAIGDHWLEHIGLDTGSLKATRQGRRQDF